MLVSAFGTSSAWADHGHFRGHAGSPYYGHYYGPRIGLYLDPWPLYYPGPAYYAYPQRVISVMPAAPTVYVEQGSPAIEPAAQQNRPAAQSNDWFYCHNPDGYYPYVKTCSGEWQRVPSQPVTEQQSPQ